MTKDLSHLNVVRAAEKGIEAELTGPDGEATGVKLKFLGFDADRVVQAARAFDKETADNPRTGEHPDDLQSRRRAAIVAAAVTDWDDLTLDGEKVTAHNAGTILNGRAYGWISQFVYAKGSLRNNLFPKGSVS